MSLRFATPACRGPGSGSLPGRGTGTASPFSIPSHIRTTLLVLAALLLPFTAVTGAPAASTKRPKTAKDIKWPKPSQKPGTVTFKSRYPTEAAWNPLLERFRTETGPAFDAMIKLAEQSAQQLKTPRTWRTTHPSPPAPAKAGQGAKDNENVGGGTTRRLLEPAPAGQDAQDRENVGGGTRRRPPAPATGQSGPDTPPPLLKAIDIVRIPTLTGEKLDAKLATLRRQLSVLEAEGYDTAVWETTDLPVADDLDAWAGKCFATFTRPPILMLGWHISKGKILPSPPAMATFLQRYASRCHSIMHTGEELNTQYIADPDGGPSLPFFSYWIGVIRKASPGTFVWARIDEVLHRRNERQTAWLEHLVPLTDGVCYQVSHSPLDVRRGREVSRQFAVVLEHRKDTAATRTGARETGQPGSYPLLLGGFWQGIPVVSGYPDWGRAGATKTLGEYESWLRDHGIQGHVRFVGFLPAKPEPDLIGREIAGSGQQEAGE